MALSIVDIYQKLLPKTNCRECGFPTCLAFAGMVVSEKHPLENCPHIPPELLEPAKKELSAQYAEGKWLKKDPAESALAWAKERAASMAVEDLPGRIGGEIIETDSGPALRLPYFNEFLIIRPGTLEKADGSPLNRWEQVFVFNHLAQGGDAVPSGEWKAFQEFPNTVSKVKSMIAHVEEPLSEHFAGKREELRSAGQSVGGEDVTDQYPSADLAMKFTPLPRVPVLLIYWEADPAEAVAAKIKLLFDETVPRHLDIESILFLSERLRQLLREEEPERI